MFKSDSLSVFKDQLRLVCDSQSTLVCEVFEFMRHSANYGVERVCSKQIVCRLIVADVAITDRYRSCQLDIPNSLYQFTIPIQGEFLSVKPLKELFRRTFEQRLIY